MGEVFMTTMRIIIIIIISIIIIIIIVIRSHFGSSPYLLLLSHWPLSSLWLAIVDIAGHCAEGIKDYTRTSMQIFSVRCLKSMNPRAVH